AAAVLKAIWHLLDGPAWCLHDPVQGHVIEHDDSAHYETPFRAGCGKTAGAGSWSGGAARCRRGGVVAGTFIGGRRAWGGQTGGTVLGRAAVRLGLVAGVVVVPVAVPEAGERPGL